MAARVQPESLPGATFLVAPSPLPEPLGERFALRPLATPAEAEPPFDSDSVGPSVEGPEIRPWNPFGDKPPFPATVLKEMPCPPDDGPPRMPKITDAASLRELGRELGADPSDIEQAVLMFEAGLTGKAIRLVHCGCLGRLVQCVEGHGFFLPYRCQNRYHRHCMPTVFQALFGELLRRLAPVAETLVPEWPVIGHRPLRVVAKIDFTVPNPGCMATPEEVRQFNRDVRRFFLTLAKRMGWRKGGWGAAWCCEFGPGNTNLHAHGVYCGPFIPQKGKEASRLWSEIRGEESFVSVKAARNFQHALRHAIKYPAADWKHFNSTPERMASLEIAFNRTRRVHAVGAFYNPSRVKEEEKSGGLGACPICNSPLGYLMGSKWRPVSELIQSGVRSLDAAREESSRVRAFSAAVLGESPP